MQLLTRLGYTATRLADDLGVQRSGISHILSGRNQPSYDFMVKLLSRFPDINAEWLILGKGNMYKSAKTTSESEITEKNKPYPNPEDADLFSVPANPLTSTNLPFSEMITNVTLVKRIVVLYADQTFSIYSPAGKD